MPLHFRLLLSKFLAVHLHAAQKKNGEGRKEIQSDALTFEGGKGKKSPNSRVVLVLNEVELLLDPLQRLVNARHSLVAGRWTAAPAASAL